ncbi:MAG: ribosomal protein S18-alanine N-acetyltransferase [Thomasclavelia sp.]|nr:ribosomal protein S18-alanine N-acetyltransferase [Thomasclavelia sp.]
MLVREVNEDDLEDIVLIDNENFNSNWSKDIYLYELNNNPFSYYLLAEEDNRIIGFIGSYFLGDQIQISRIAVAKDFQRKGIGSILINKIIEESINNNCSINLEVRTSNAKAINLYEKHGFKKVSTRKNYYSDTGEDAYLYVKEMEG